LRAGLPAHLAVATQAAADRGRLLLLDPAGTVVYDEVLAGSVRLLTARREDGCDTLLLSDGQLRALRRRVGWPTGGGFWGAKPPA